MRKIRALKSLGSEKGGSCEKFCVCLQFASLTPVMGAPCASPSTGFVTQNSTARTASMNAIVVSGIPG